LQKRSQLFIGTNDETVSVAMRVGNLHMMRRSVFDTRPHPMNILPQSMKRFFHCKDFADDSCFHLI
jgi:hypothetical protein